MKQILLILLSLKLSAQLPPMKFSCSGGDTIKVSVYVDKDCISRLSVKCTSLTHHHDCMVGVTIGFVDGTFLEILSVNNYEIKDFHKLSEMQFDYFSFDELLSSKACLKIKTKDYFIRFFNP